jgi:hypothetical protein
MPGYVSEHAEQSRRHRIGMMASVMGLGNEHAERLYNRVIVPAIHDKWLNTQEADRYSLAYAEGYSDTRFRLDERVRIETLGVPSSQHIPKAYETNAGRRVTVEDVHRIAVSESQFISQSTGRKYAEEAYRLGARMAVMEFSDEYNHRLAQDKTQAKTMEQTQFMGMVM